MGSPLIVVMVAIFFLLTSPLRDVLLTVVLVGVGLLAVLAGLRWLTLERYLE